MFVLLDILLDFWCVIFGENDIVFDVCDKMLDKYNVLFVWRNVWLIKNDVVLV